MCRPSDIQYLVDAFDPRSSSNTVCGPKEVQIFADSHVVVFAELIGHIAYQSLDLFGLG